MPSALPALWPRAVIVPVAVYSATGTALPQCGPLPPEVGGDMYTAVYVYDFPARSSKLSSRSLRVGNKELLLTTQFQTTLSTASGER